MSPFLPPHDPRLNEPSLEVSQEELSSTGLQDLIDRMYVIAGGQRGAPEKRGLVGLAAPQIGVFKRLILVDIGVDTKRTAWGKLRVYINPRIIASSTELALDREGCFSVDSHVCGVVPRAKQITLTAWDREGNLIEETHVDYTARIFQHEIDHLDGKRFPDRIGKQGKLHWVEPDEYPEYRLQWQNWPRSLLLEDWIAMKNGIYTKAPE